MKQTISLLMTLALLSTGCSEETTSTSPTPPGQDSPGANARQNPAPSPDAGQAVTGQPPATGATAGFPGSTGQPNDIVDDPPSAGAGTGGPSDPIEVFDAGTDGATAQRTPPGSVNNAGSDAPPPNDPDPVTPLPPGGTEPTMLPTPNGECPTIATGSVQILGTSVELWVGDRSDTQKGPIYIYWHGTGGSSAMASFDIDATLRSEVLGLGGVIAAPNQTTGTGNPIDWGVWNTGDFEIADQVVACAIEQLNIDTRRIYTGGSSAGGLAASVMGYQRSGYLAAANPNSGGLAPWPFLNTLQDPSHVAAIMTMHGAQGADLVVIDFADVSVANCVDVAAKGGFAVDCDHGGGHCMAPGDLKAAGWEFMKAHPYGTKPSPYEGGLPASFPSYCQIIQ